MRDPSNDQDRDPDTAELYERAADIQLATQRFLQTLSRRFDQSLGMEQTPDWLSEEERERLDEESAEIEINSDRAPKKRSLFQRVAAVGALVLAVGAGVWVFSDYRSSTSVELAEGVSLADGLPQRGAVLGRRKADTEAILYADPADPYTREIFAGGLTEVISDEVQSGRVKIRLMPWPSVDPASARASRVIAAAAEQDRAWEVALTVVANQREWGSEEEIIEALTDAGVRVNTEKLRDAVSSSNDQLALKADKQTRKLGVSSSPVVVFSKRDRVLEAPFGNGQLVEAFARASKD